MKKIIFLLIIFLIFLTKKTNSNYEYLEKAEALKDIAQLLFDLRYYEQAIEYCDKSLLINSDNNSATKKLRQDALECLSGNMWYHNYFYKKKNVKYNKYFFFFIKGLDLDIALHIFLIYFNCFIIVISNIFSFEISIDHF